MRTIEIVLTITLGVCILLVAYRKYFWGNWISFGAVAVMLAHIGLEGYRWQMIPLYGIALGLGIFSLRRITPLKTNPNSPHRGAIFRLLGGLLILGVAVLPPIFLPVPHTSGPTGPYSVGTISFMLVDDSRLELYSETTGDPRRLMVQIWYPANPDSGSKPAPWMDHMEVMGPAISNYLGFPDFFLDHIAYARSHAYPNAPAINPPEGFPIILFSHGWNGFRAQNTYQVEELASHGYIVVAPDHTYGAVATVFPDGSVALNNPLALPTGMELSDAEFLAAANLLGDQWASDLSFILDHLERARPDDEANFLADKIDFSRVGVMGHSTGGGAAIDFCATDNRCKAALGMDPYMDPVNLSIQFAGMDRPYLAMFSESWYRRDNQEFDRFYQNLSGEAYQFAIQGTSHYDFTDLPAFSPLAYRLGLKGPLNGSRVLRIVNDYTLAFFDYYFKGIPSPLLAGPSDGYPELIWR